VGVVEQHSETILSVSYKQVRPFRIATVSEDHTSNFYEGPPFKFLKQHDKGHTPNCVRFSPDGNLYALVGATIHVHEGKDGAHDKEIKDEKNGHKGTIVSICWSPDSKRFMTCGMDKTVKIWNYSSGSVETTFEIGGKGTDFWYQQVSVLWVGSYLLSLSLNGAINYLDEKTPTQINSIHGVQQPFSGYSYNSSTGLLYTADGSGHLTTWDPIKGTAKWWSATNSHSKIITGLAVNAGGSHLWSVGHDNVIKYNDLKEHSFSSGSAALGAGPVAVAAASKDGGLAAVLLSDKLLIVREEKVVNTVEFKATGFCLRWAPDDTTVAVGCGDGKIRMFEVNKDAATLSSTHEGQHVGKVVALNYSPEGALVSMGFDRSIYFWTGKDKVSNKTGWPHHNASVVSSAFSSNGLMATGSQDQRIIIWTDLKGMDDTKKIAIEMAHLEGVLFVTFLKDDLILSIGFDKTIKTWKI